MERPIAWCEGTLAVPTNEYQANECCAIRRWRTDMEQLHMKIFVNSDLSLLPNIDSVAMQDTIYLLSVPGMCDSVKEGLAESAEDLAKSLDW